MNEVLEELSLYEEDSECLQTLRVNFLDMGGTREASVDDGGPGREFACCNLAHVAAYYLESMPQHNRSTVYDIFHNALMTWGNYRF